MKRLGSITATELGTLWWSVRWVRGLVLMLIPVGIVDTIYTISMVAIYGAEVEFNPITRAALESGLWLLWGTINILGFTFFCMLAGSYYLHTRNDRAGPDTFWLSTIISLRVSMAAYNVTFYYIPVVVTVHPPLWVGIFAFIGSLYLLNKLFRRKRDLSWRDATSFVTSRMDNRTDARLIKEATAGIKAQDKPLTEPGYLGLMPEQNGVPVSREVWVKRIGYLVASGLTFIAMAVALQIVAIVTDRGWNFEYVVLNQYTGPIVVISLGVIIIFISLAMVFLFRAFTLTSGDELLV